MGERHRDREDGVVLASARRRGRATVGAFVATPGWTIEQAEERLTRELNRSLRGLTQVFGDSMRSTWTLRRHCCAVRRILSQPLPDQATRTFRELTAVQPAAIVAQGTEVERMVRQRVGQDVFRQALMDS